MRLVQSGIRAAREVSRPGCQRKLDQLQETDWPPARRRQASGYAYQAALGAFARPFRRRHESAVRQMGRFMAPAAVRGLLEAGSRCCQGWSIEDIGVVCLSAR